MVVGWGCLSLEVKGSAASGMWPTGARAARPRVHYGSCHVVVGLPGAGLSEEGMMLYQATGLTVQIRSSWVEWMSSCQVASLGSILGWLSDIDGRWETWRAGGRLWSCTPLGIVRLIYLTRVQEGSVPVHDRVREGNNRRGKDRGQTGLELRAPRQFPSCSMG